MVPEGQGAEALAAAARAFRVLRSVAGARALRAWHRTSCRGIGLATAIAKGQIDPKSLFQCHDRRNHTIRLAV